MQTQNPNIIFFLPDQFRGDWLPYTDTEFEFIGTDRPPVKMPIMRDLMDKGAVFTNAYTPSPLCAPARACLASGKKYANCEVYNNAFDYPADMPTFYSALKNVGYSVGGVGKFDLHKKTHWWGLDGWVDEFDKMGFTHAIDNAGKGDAVSYGEITPQDPYMVALDKYGLREYHVNNFKARGLRTDITELPQHLYCDNWITQNAVDMIKKIPENQPWFLQVNFTGPHSPFDVTEYMRKRWENVDFSAPHNVPKNTKYADADHNSVRQNYAAMIENIDSCMGQILNAIEEKSSLDNTIIVFSADHGDMLGDYGRYGKTVPHKPSIHIPLVVYAPNTNKGALINKPVSLTDLANTFLDFANTSLDSADDSYTLRPLLTGEGEYERKHLCSALDKSVSQGETGKIDTERLWSAVITEDYKLVCEKEKPDSLYSMKNDPWQENNIIQDEKYIEIVKTLREMIE